MVGGYCLRATLNLGRITKSNGEKLIYEDDTDSLRIAGLSLAQAKVYLALLQIGKSSIATVAKAAEIGSANTCRTMTTLENLALVNKTISMPKLYEAVSMRDAIDILLKKKADEYSKVQVATESLYKKFGQIEEGGTLEEGNQFLMIPQKNSYMHLSLRFWRNAEHTVDVISTVKRAVQSLDFYNIERTKVLQRGASIRSILRIPNNWERGEFWPEHDKKEKKLFAKPNWQERVITGAPDVIGAIFDNKVATFIINPVSNYPESPCLVTNHKGFIVMFHGYFENLWNSATEITENEVMTREGK